MVLKIRSFPIKHHDSRAVTVIGAGVIGLSCAWQLVRQGYIVTVIHDQPIGTGASGNAAGSLKPFHALQKGNKHKLQLQSIWSYPEFLKNLAADSGIPIPYKQCDRWVVYHRNSGWEKAKRAVKIANETWPTQPAQSISPNIDDYAGIIADSKGVICCHATAIFDPSVMLRSLHEACLRKGVIFKQEKIEQLPAVRPLVLAAGAFCGKLLPDIKIYPIKRQAILLEWPVSDKSPVLPHLIESGQVYLVPWHDGKAVYVGSTFEPEAEFDNTPTEKAEIHLRYHAERLIPELENAKLLQRFSGLQSRGAGESTLLLGEVPNHNGVFVAAGHGGVGFCMAPITAQLIVKDIDKFNQQ